MKLVKLLFFGQGKTPLKNLGIPEGMKLASVWAVWAFIAVGAVGWALFVILEAFGVLKDGAAWIQAVGSIAAIWGAFSISNQQSKRQEAQRVFDELEKKKRFRGILIYLADKHLQKTKLLKDAVQQAYFGSETIGPYLDAKYHLEWSSHLEALKAIDINNLEPLEVGVVIDMQVATQFSMDVCSRLETSWEPAGDREESDIERLRYFRREAKANFRFLLENVPFLKSAGNQN